MNFTLLLGSVYFFSSIEVDEEAQTHNKRGWKQQVVTIMMCVVRTSYSVVNSTYLNLVRKVENTEDHDPYLNDVTNDQFTNLNLLCSSISNDVEGLFALDSILETSELFLFWPIIEGSDKYNYNDGY